MSSTKGWNGFFGILCKEFRAEYTSVDFLPVRLVGLIVLDPKPIILPT
jgi:hypothetical protein